jgi:hypothetical protein
LELLGELVGVLHALDVTTRAGITVPVPRTAHTVAGLEDPNGTAEGAQAMQHVQTCESGTDDDGVDRAGRRTWALAQRTLL